MSDNSKLVKRVLKHAFPSCVMSQQELRAICRTLTDAEQYGYGNLIAWLATAWALNLRDEEGLDEKTATAQVSNRTPYPLPPRHFYKLAAQLAACEAGRVRLSRENEELRSLIHPDLSYQVHIAALAEGKEALP